MVCLKNKNGDKYFIGRSLIDTVVPGQIAGRISPVEQNFHYCDINQEPPLNIFYYQSPLEGSPLCKTVTEYQYLEVSKKNNA